MSKIKIFYQPYSLNARDFQHPEYIYFLQFLQQEEWLKFFKNNPNLLQKCLLTKTQYKIIENQMSTTFIKEFEAEEKGESVNWIDVQSLDRLEKHLNDLSNFSYDLYHYIDNEIKKQNFDFIKKLYSWKPLNINNIVNELTYFVYTNQLYATIDLNVNRMLSFYKELDIPIPDNMDYSLNFDKAGHVGDCACIPHTCDQCLIEDWLGISTVLAKKDDNQYFLNQDYIVHHFSK